MIREKAVERLSYYSLDELERLSGGDQGFIVDIILTITESCPIVAQSLENHFQSGDMDALSFTLHKFKSTINILGNSDLSILISELEHNAKNRVTRNMLEEDLGNLVSAINVLTDKLQTEVAKSN